MKHSKIGLIFQITFLLIISNQIYGAAGPSSSKPQELYINNQSGYAIKIVTPDLGRISNKEIRKVTTIPPKIKYQTAGEILGKISRTHEVNLEQKIQNMRFDQNDALQLTIKTSWMGTLVDNLEVVDREFMRASLGLIPASGNPWEVFPQLKHWCGSKNIIEYAKKLDPKTLARYVINLEKEYTKEQLDKKYRELNLLWHPDKHPDSREFATQVTQIINTAREILNTGQGNFDNLF